MVTGTTLRRPFGITAAVLAVFALAGCGAAARGAAPSPQPVADGQDAVARARADSARHPYTAADVHFMTVMIGHHSQAVAIAAWAPTHGAGPSVRALAERIVNGQQDEIATMRRWLADRGQPVPDAPASGAAGTHGTAHAAHGTHGAQQAPMPGMLSEAQLRQLDQARGAEFDRLFLTFMIQHHRGAVAMVERLFGTYGAGQDETVFKFASDVNVDQTTEIARMQRMLAALTLESDNP